ncbi:MAG TPA: glycosyltransferase domain-containing protein [Candidatus Udaeobacter sp.]|nr:glycosyltransferase domain-containing protein [Candidatus Udaeobacter sp.]
MRRAVYTILVGGSDAFLSPLHAEPGLDYIAFTDAGEAPHSPWQARPLAAQERNPRMTARWHKLHPHRLLPDYRESLYIDANILIKKPIVPLFEQVLLNAPLAMFRHPNRDCSYTEAEAVKRLRYDDGAIVDAQMAYYRAHGLPIGAGLHFGGIMFRRHEDGALTKMLEDWWRQLKIFSHRDQLSLEFMLRRHGMTVEDIPGLAPDNPWFAIGPHRRNRIDFASGLAPAEADEIDWLRMAFVDAARHGPRAWGSRLAEAKDSALRLARMPRTLIVRTIRRLAWRKYAARSDDARRRAL